MYLEFFFNVYHDMRSIVRSDYQKPMSVPLSSRCSNSSLMKDQTYWAYNYCPTSYSWLVLLGLVFYLAAFAPGTLVFSVSLLSLIHAKMLFIMFGNLKLGSIHIAMT